MEKRQEITNYKLPISEMRDSATNPKDIKMIIQYYVQLYANECEIYMKSTKFLEK